MKRRDFLKIPGVVFVVPAPMTILAVGSLKDKKEGFQWHNLDKPIFLKAGVRYEIRIIDT